MVYNLEGSWLDLRLEPIYLTQLGWPLSLKKLPIKLCSSEAILHDANMILNRVTTAWKPVRLVLRPPIRRVVCNVCQKMKNLNGEMNGIF